MCEEKGLLAGFGKVDITPDYVTGLGGYGNAESRFHENVLERVFTTCVALSEGEETVENVAAPIEEAPVIPVLEDEE